MQLLKYVPTCSVASKRYCTNSTLCNVVSSVIRNVAPLFKVAQRYVVNLNAIQTVPCVQLKLVFSAMIYIWCAVQ